MTRCPTLGHELTHYIRENSPEKFKAFADLTMEAFGNRGVSADALVQEQIAKASRNGRSINYETAYEEMVADSMETILTDGKALEKLRQIQQKDSGLGQTIQKWAKDAAEKIRAVVDAYKGEKPDSLEGRITAQLEEVLPQLEELYAEGLADASGTGTATSGEGMKNATPEGGVKYSIRQTEDGRAVAVVDDDILAHMDTTNWDKDKVKEAKSAAKKALEKFSDGIVVNGITRNVNRVSKKEFTRSKYTEKLANKAQGVFADKMRMADVVGDIVTVATGWAKDGGLKHERNDDFVDFDHGHALIAAGENRYNAEVVVGITGKGEYVFYDVVDITPEAFQLEKEPLTTATTDKPIGDIQRGSSGINVAQNTQNVNRNSSKEFAGSLHSDRDTGSTRPYSYDSLVSKPDMEVTKLSGDVPGNRADVIYQAKQNAAKIGKFNSKDGSVSVYVKDMDSNVIIGRDGLKHSIDRRLDVNAPVILKAGEILSNSIRINEMTPKLDNASNSYVLIGAAENGDGDIYVVRSVVNRFKNELVSMDVLYAINAKKEPAALLPLSTEKSALGTGSTISISNLLDYVNNYFPDILPEEVLKHYGYESRPDGKLGESVLYSDRDPEAVKRNQILEKQNEDLKDTVQYLKELVKLQGKVTDGTVYSLNSVEWAGKQMMKEAGAKGDIRELTGILEKTYRAMGEGSEDMTQLIDQAAGWLAEHRKTEGPKLDSYAEGILKEMKGRSIALNESLKAEAEALLGSYGDYRKRFFGSLNSRSPHGERGLKYGGAGVLSGDTASLPSRGAWIEIYQDESAIIGLSQNPIQKGGDLVLFFLFSEQFSANEGVPA